jgi:hypothetical protein
MKPADSKIETFASLAEARYADYWEASGYTFEAAPSIVVKPGRKYAKLVLERPNGNGGSVFAFVDRETGLVYKPAGWSAPAKHARGDVNSAEFGLEALSPAGSMPSVRYL